eukprot:UN31809
MICREIDLALVSVADEQFWKNLPILKITNEIAELGSSVCAVGYPTGSDGLSITRGVVSRVVCWPCLQKGDEVLHIQIDAAINPGNSGGPVFDSDGTVIGVARAGMLLHQNIGFILAPANIQLLLQQFDKFHEFKGLASAQIRIQQLENSSIRKALKIPSDIKEGVRVKEVAKLGTFGGLLQQNDVLLEIGDRRIASDGTISLTDERQNERVKWHYAVSQTIVGDPIKFVYLRDGKEYKEKTTAKSAHHLIPVVPQRTCKERYYMLGGLIFIPVTLPWLAETRMLAKDDFTKYYKDYPEDPEREIVVLAKILAHETNFGYSFGKKILTHYNDTEIRNLQHLVDLTCSSKKDFDEFK